MGRFAFALAGEGSERLEIDVYSMIAAADSPEAFWFDALSSKAVLDKLKANKGVSEILLRINSDGGDVFEAMSIYALLVESGARIDVDVDGLAASAASIIAMAGDEIRMRSGSWMMIHRAWGGIQGFPEALRQWADVLEKVSGQAADIYAARTGLDRKKILDMLTEERWMTAQEAKRLGFADKVVAPKGKPSPKASKARAMAFASVRTGDYSNMPDELQRLVEAHRTPPEPKGRSNDSAPSAQQTLPSIGTDNEDQNMAMAFSKSLTDALNLIEGADEKTVLNAIQKLSARAEFAGTLEQQMGKSGKEALAFFGDLSTQHKNLSAFAASIEKETGKKGDEAIGIVMAWKESHGKLPELEAKIAEANKEKEKSELSEFIEGARTGQAFDDKKPRLTKNDADVLCKQIEEGKIALAAAKAFVQVKSPVPHLAGSPEPDEAKAGMIAGTMAWNGKAYEALSNGERAQLAHEDEELFGAMRKDWIKRGEPEVTAAAS